MPSIRPRPLPRPLALLVAGALIAAATVATPVRAAAGLTLTTPYPGVNASPNSRVSFDLEVEANEAGRINLEVTGVPGSWDASLHGSGLVVTAVQVNGTDPVDVRLDVEVPADASGRTRLVVVASDSESRVELPIEINVAADASGEVTVEPNFEALRGAAGGSFSFTLTITNDRAEDLTFTAAGQGPAGWTVEATPTGQAQAVSGTVEAGATASVSVTVNAPDDAVAGTYDIPVVTTVGAERIEIPLQIEITGSYSLSLSARNLVLSGRGSAGSVTEHTFTVTNTGTAPLTNVQITATAPTEWDFTFETPTIATIAPDDVVEVVAKITPAGSAIAGDYEITVRAAAEEANDSAELRFTVEASLLGAILGGLLIVGAIGGLYWVFRRYGRR